MGSLTPGGSHWCLGMNDRGVTHAGGSLTPPTPVVVAVACDVRRVRRVGVGLPIFGGGVVRCVVFGAERGIALGRLSPLVLSVGRAWSSLWR